VTPNRKRLAPQQGVEPVARQAGTVPLLPMEIQIGDRFTDGEYECDATMRWDDNSDLPAGLTRFRASITQLEVSDVGVQHPVDVCVVSFD
jgi:hypothetical protein